MHIAMPILARGVFWKSEAEELGAVSLRLCYFWYGGGFPFLHRCCCCFFVVGAGYIHEPALSPSLFLCVYVCAVGCFVVGRSVGRGRGRYIKIFVNIEWKGRFLDVDPRR